MMTPVDMVLPGCIAVFLVLGITWWVMRTEVHRGETAFLVSCAVAAGALAGGISRVILAAVLAAIAAGETGDDMAVAVLLMGIITIAVVEEGMKMGGVALFHRHLDEIENGIVYGIAIGCGFALTGIVLMPLISGTVTEGTLPELLFTVPVIAVVQTVTGGMVGLGLGRSLFPVGKYRWKAPVLLLSGAVLLHALLISTLTARQVMSPDPDISMVLSVIILLCGVLSVAILVWLDHRVRLYDIGGMVRGKALR